MGQCLSIPPGLGRAPSKIRKQQQQHKGPCELHRVPHQVFVSILMLLEQQELLQTTPLVCRAWQQASNEALQRMTLDLSGSDRQQQLPYMLSWLQGHGSQLKQLQLSTSTPLGRASRQALLRSLCNGPCCCSLPTHGASTRSTAAAIIHSCSSSSSSRYMINAWALPSRSAAAAADGGADDDGLLAYQSLQLQQLVLQMDLDVTDLAFLAHVLQHAPHLSTLKLQPLKPSLADLQLLVLACIVGNLIGADAPGPVLPHLTGCSDAISRLASSATQLRSLSLSRYDLACVSYVAGAAQLTSLSLQHCSLTDNSLLGLGGLSRLQHLELPDNHLTPAGLVHIAELQHLTHLDLSVMPSRSRMRSAHAANIAPLTQLHHLASLNIIGFGVADVCPLSRLSDHLVTLEAGLNPLSSDSLRAIGRLQALQHLELGGVSQAWMLSSGLPPDMSIRGHQHSWYSLNGLQALTALDLGGSHFSSAVWVSHMCPLLASMTGLQRLMLAHCSIPPGKMQYLLPDLSTQLVELSVDRCPVAGDELLGLSHLSRLTRLSAAAMSPVMDNRQAALLTHLHSLQHLVVRGNAINGRGAKLLARGLTALTCLDLTHCPVSRRTSKQLAHLMPPADGNALSDLEASC